jgi:hypothetical protein
MISNTTCYKDLHVHLPAICGCMCKKEDTLDSTPHFHFHWDSDQVRGSLQWSHHRATCDLAQLQMENQLLSLEINNGTDFPQQAQGAYGKLFVSCLSSPPSRPPSTTRALQHGIERKSHRPNQGLGQGTSR